MAEIEPTPSKPAVYQVKVRRSVGKSQERVLNVEADSREKAKAMVKEGLKADNNPINDPNANEDWVDLSPVEVSGVTVVD